MSTIDTTNQKNGSERALAHVNSLRFRTHNPRSNNLICKRIDMKKWIWALGLSSLAYAIPASAAITDVTGDIDIGISRDVMQSTFVCKANVWLNVIQMIADGKHSQSEKLLETGLREGDCVKANAQSVTVTGVRMAKISGIERKEASIYALAHVRGKNFNGYVGPSTLSERGFDIIKTVQIMNKKMGAPLVQ